jgi:hypothetical protein
MLLYLDLAKPCGYATGDKSILPVRFCDWEFHPVVVVAMTVLAVREPRHPVPARPGKNDPNTPPVKRRRRKARVYSTRKYSTI